MLCARKRRASSEHSCVWRWTDQICSVKTGPGEHCISIGWLASVQWLSSTHTSTIGHHNGLSDESHGPYSKYVCYACWYSHEQSTSTLQLRCFARGSTLSYSKEGDVKNLTFTSNVVIFVLVCHVLLQMQTSHDQQLQILTKMLPNYHKLLKSTTPSSAAALVA